MINRFYGFRFGFTYKKTIGFSNKKKISIEYYLFYRIIFLSDEQMKCIEEKF